MMTGPGTSAGDSKLEREREFHNRIFSAGKAAREDRVRKYYSICDSFAYYRRALGHDLRGVRALEYGCGPGSLAFDLSRRGALVTGIDLSDVAIDQARGQADREGLAGVDFLRMDAEELRFDSDTFDLICGSAILHHLDLDRAFGELSRVLRPSGRAVFVEPLGHNPAINLYRRLTPTIRTVDEHPLRAADFRMARRHFAGVESRHFALFTLMAVPFRSLPIFGLLRRALDAADRALFRVVPPTRWHAWQVVIELSKPREAASARWTAVEHRAGRPAPSPPKARPTGEP